MGKGRFGSWGGYSGNKRVHNATKVVMGDGVKADSKLEAYMYGKLKGAGIEFEFKRRFELQEGFTWRGEKVRKIEWVSDFYFGWCGLVLDTKGFVTEKAEIKLKLFKYRYRELELLLPGTKEGVDREFLYILSKWVQYRGTL